MPKQNRGEVWLVDLGMVAKVRPCLVFLIHSSNQLWVALLRIGILTPFLPPSHRSLTITHKSRGYGAYIFFFAFHVLMR